MQCTSKAAKEGSQAASDGQGSVQHNQPLQAFNGSILIVSSHVIEQATVVEVDFLLDISLSGGNEIASQHPEEAHTISESSHYFEQQKGTSLLLFHLGNMNG